MLIGRDDAEVKQRARGLKAVFGGDGEAFDPWFEARRPRWVLGTPGQAREVVGRLAAVGVERFVLQDFLPMDLDMIDLAAEALFD